MVEERTENEVPPLTVVPPRKKTEPHVLEIAATP